MESLQLPLREIKKRYTRSEIAIMSWRSKEMSVNMRKGHKQPTQKEAVENTKELPAYGLQHQPRNHPASRVVEHEDSYELPQDINNGVRIPKIFFNNEGEIDLSKATGPQAVMYLNAVGLNIPTIWR